MRHWGVSNFDVVDMEELVSLTSADSIVASNQVLYNLARRGIQYDLLPWCRKRRISMMAYSPLEQGRLAKDKTVQAIAERLDATPAQAALAWVLRQQGIVAIPKAADLETRARDRAHRISNCRARISTSSMTCFRRPLTRVARDGLRRSGRRSLRPLKRLTTAGVEASMQAGKVNGGFRHATLERGTSRRLRGLAWLVAIGTAAAAISTAEAKRLQSAAEVVRALRDHRTKASRTNSGSRRMRHRHSRRQEGGARDRRRVRPRRHELPQRRGLERSPVHAARERQLGTPVGRSRDRPVLLVMNREGAAKLLNNNVSLGVGASLAAGPVGRAANAATDAQMHAESCPTRELEGSLPGSISRAAR